MTWLIKHQQNHPYWFSFYISTIAMFLLLFFIVQLEVVQDISSLNSIELIDIDEISAPKRQTKQNISEDSNNLNATDTQRARGQAGAEGIDLDMYPSIAAPKMLTRMNNEHPKRGKDLNLEADVIAELIISSSGRVLDVKVNRVILSKKLPKDLEAKVKKDYAQLITKRVRKQRYSPTVYRGKYIEVIVTYQFHFALK